jgi:hypothetical protein
MADLDHPAPGLLVRVAPHGVDFFTAIDHMDDVAARYDDAQAVGTSVACIGAQVLADGAGAAERSLGTAFRWQPVRSKCTMASNTCRFGLGGRAVPKFQM